MNKARIGVVGAGVVGKAVQQLFGPDTVMYDPKPGFCHDQEAVNACDAAFVCVPTPMGSDGACDTSIVEEVVSWLETPLIIIRSTVIPGTTDRLREAYNKRIIFQPEYTGETVAHPFAREAESNFVILGGPQADTSYAADLYKCYHNSMIRFHFCDAVTAELTKYMENAFFAVKVTFVNEFYDIAKAHGVDFNVLREIWLADARISRDHTFVYSDNRGFSGRCLPKDVNALVHSCLKSGYDPRLLRATLKINESFTALNLRHRSRATEPA